MLLRVAPTLAPIVEIGPRRPLPCPSSEQSPQPDLPLHLPSPKAATPTPPSPPPSPPAFPNEILKQIIHSVQPTHHGTLAALLSVNKHFFHLTHPLIYRKFVFNFHSTQSGSSSSLACINYSRSKNNLAPKNNLVSKHFPSKSLCLDAMKIAIIPPHAVSRCSDNHTSRTLIPVDTLRIYLDPKYTRGRPSQAGQFHSLRFNIGWDDGKVVADPKKCVVANQFKPREVVYRGFKLDEDVDGCGQRPYCKAAERVVVVIDKGGHQYRSSSSPFDLAPNGSKELVIIFHTKTVKDRWEGTKYPYAQQASVADFVESLQRHLERFMEKRTGKVRMVNAGCIDAVDLGKEELDYEATQKVFGEVMKRGLRKSGDKAKDGEAEGNRLEVVGMKEWLKEGKWEGVFERRDISGWLEEIGDPLFDHVDGTEVQADGGKVFDKNKPSHRVKMGDDSDLDSTDDLESILARGRNAEGSMSRSRNGSENMSHVSDSVVDDDVGEHGEAEGSGERAGVAEGGVIIGEDGSHRSVDWNADHAADGIAEDTTDREGDNDEKPDLNTPGEHASVQRRSQL